MILTLPSLPGVYRIVDTKSGRFYIGSSVNIAKRWVYHLYRFGKGTHPNPTMQAIWNADPQRLQVDVIELCEPEKDEILRREQFHLDAAGVGANRECLNVLAIAGSHLGRKRSEETRAALSRAMQGRVITPETRQKMRAAKLGKTLTAEHRQNLSKARKGMKCAKRPWKPRPQDRMFSPEQVREIRAAKASGVSYSTLQRMYGVSSPGPLHSLVKRKTYADIL
jgi:group I intron endonuclease